MTSRKRSKASKKGWKTRRRKGFILAGFSEFAAKLYSESDPDRINALLQTREIALGGGPENFKKRFKLSEPGETPILSANKKHDSNWKGNLEGLRLMVEAEEKEFRWYMKVASDILGFTTQEARTAWFSPKARTSTVK